MDNQLRADAIFGELVTIRKLLLLAILKSGVPQDAVAAALSVNQSSVSRMLRSRQPSRAKIRNKG